MKKLFLIAFILGFSILAKSQSAPDTVHLYLNGGVGEAQISQMIRDSLANYNLNGYTKAQVDSISAVIRSEITSGSGGVSGNADSLDGQPGSYYLHSETDPVVVAINGIVKSNGSTISAATPGTDYLTPTGSAAGLTSFPTLNQSTTGNAATATKLSTARTIAGVSFDGSANISLNNNAITNGAAYITSVPAQSFSSLTGVPTTLSGYGITDAAPLASPTFTGVVTIPTPFKVGSTSITATAAQMNYLVGVTSAIQTQFTAKAALASPTFTGTPLSTTPTAGDNSTKIATTAFTATAITNALSTYLTSSTAAATFQPIENQRLSTTNNVTFNNVSATNYLGVNTSSAATYLYENPHATSFANVMYLPRYTNDTLATKGDLAGKLDTGFVQTDTVVYPLVYTAGIGLHLSSTYLDSLASVNNPAFTGTVAKLASDTLATKAYARSVGGINFASLPVYATQADAVEGGLTNGQPFLVSADLNGNRMLAVIDTIGDPNVNWLIDNTTGTEDSYSFKADSYGTNFNLKIFWGDGTADSTTYVGTDTYTPTHTYATGAKYKIDIISSNNTAVNELYINPSGATQYVLDNVQNLNIFSSLNIASFSSCTMASALLDSITYPSSLGGLFINGTEISSYNPTKSLPANLSNLDISNNTGISTFIPTIPLPATITSLTLNNNDWTSSEVDAELDYLVTQTFNSDAKVMNISQSGSAPPTGSGITDVTTLTSNGWTITHD